MPGVLHLASLRSGLYRVAAALRDSTEQTGATSLQTALLDFKREA